jgi:hypothetical protein
MVGRHRETRIRCYVRFVGKAKRMCPHIFTLLCKQSPRTARSWRHAARQASLQPWLVILTFAFLSFVATVTFYCYRANWMSFRTLLQLTAAVLFFFFFLTRSFFIPDSYLRLFPPRYYCRCATAQRAQCADENLRTLEKPRTGWLRVGAVSGSADLLEDSGISTLRLRGSHFVY